MLIGSSAPSSAPAVAARSRLPALDGLRGAAALGVILVHVLLYIRGAGGGFGPSWFESLLGQLRLGMPAFFVLSGFLIFRPFAAAALERRPGPRLDAYGIRRVARIVPAYWLVIVVTALGLWALGHPQAQPAELLPIFLLFVQNYVPATAGHLNPPTWTVVVEVSFYVFVPLLGIAAAAAATRIDGKRRRRFLLATVCVLLLLVGTAVLGLSSLNDWGRNVRDTLPARMGSFGAGMLAAVLVHNRSAGRRAVSALALAGTFLVVLEAVFQAYGLGPSVLRHLLVDTPASIGFGLIVAAVALGPLPGISAFERGPFQWWGVRSYGLYLWHFPVIYALHSLHLWPAELLPALALTLGIATALAMVTWRWLEQPAIAWAHRRTPSRRTRPVLAGVGAPARAPADV